MTTVGRPSAAPQWSELDRLVGRQWIGLYDAVTGGRPRSMQLDIERISGSRFYGSLTWDGPASRTSCVGELVAEGSPEWDDILAKAATPELLIRFTDPERRAGADLELGGDYRAVLQSDGALVGLWYRSPVDTVPIGQFSLPAT
jgi:hypothetical protein